MAFPQHISLKRKLRLSMQVIALISKFSRRITDKSCGELGTNQILPHFYKQVKKIFEILPQSLCFPNLQTQYIHHAQAGATGGINKFLFDTDKILFIYAIQGTNSIKIQSTC